VIDRDQSFEELLHHIQQTQNVNDISIFDIYQGEHLPADKKSVALTISIQ
jgi:phenylalanyl-tRNA synthetase beta subunit